MPSTTTIRKFYVEGHGLFPFDMLRYDMCWPATEVDSGRIEQTTRRGSYATSFRIGLKGLTSPTEARWKSFGYTVKVES